MTTEQEFNDFALAIELLVAALNQVDTAQRLLGPNAVLDVAAWALRDCLHNLNDHETPRNWR